ncbi:MAG: hypothetical protein CMI02_06600 [Oceanospirillaceae bacterium]|nr:hypothetical protein [Oceanospirillaceae bacterium]MBT11685.1 hypothetical protein [Oceanospirillaceae bacterium]|tara:strand:+ start:7613 stop:9100 length:1488 start_codon:yes stop_codon:yes gene_type:complete
METDFPLEQDTTASAGAASSGSYSMSVPKLLPGQYKHLELLAHLASFSELLVAVTGPDGSGKSTLAMALSAQCEEPETSLFITADMMLGLPAILKSIAGHWDMPQLPEEPAAAKDALREFAEARAQEGKTLLVVIDQAEQFDQDTLNAIAHFALLAPQAISFTLFGASGFELQFRESPAAAPLHVLELEPLSLDDAALLLQQVYSPGQALPLSQDELLSVYEMSSGWPAGLLLSAESFFLEAGSEAPPVDADKTARTRFPLAHMLAIAVVAAALLVSFLYRGDNAAKEQPDSAAETPVQPLPTADEGTATPLTADDDTTLSPLESETVDVAPPDVASLPDYNYVDKSSEADSDKNPAQASEQAEQPVAQAEVEDARVAQPQPGVDAAAQTEEAAVPRHTKAETLLLNTRNGFVVQLFGSYQSANAAAFREDWQDDVAATLYQYQTTHNNKPWHVVVAGVFNTRAEAKAAVDTMPQALRRQSPWVRDIRAVHQALD